MTAGSGCHLSRRPDAVLRGAKGWCPGGWNRDVMWISRGMIQAGVVVLLAAGAVQAADARTRPNILLILADDLGYGDLGCQGATDLRTPHLDRLATRGLRLTEFYANCPVCSPTRAAILSGCYPDRVGVPGVIRTHADNNWGWLSPTAVLLPDVLQRAGYATAHIGKWHLGLESPNTPTERGFEHFHGWLGDMMDDYYTHRRHGINYMRHGLETIDPEGHATDLFSAWAIDWLKQQDGKRPFFLYLAYNAPHTPIQPPADWLARVQQREPEMTARRAKLAALIEHMDDGIGRVLRALEESGQAENTLIVFTSDNGGQLSVGANNGPLRDGKQSVYEGGLKVPAICVWPGKIAPGSTTDFRAMTMDVFPTLAAVAGASVKQRIDGVSFLPVLRGESQAPLRENWFFRRREGGTRYGGKTIEAILRGHWKLLQNSPFAPQELYNLEDDPQEENNVIREHPEKFRELAAALRREIQRYGQVPWQRPEPGRVSRAGDGR